MMRKTIIALFALAAVGLVQPTLASARGHWHAPSATKAHVTGLGIVLCSALPEFAPH
jgi:hypothetical protein